MSPATAASVPPPPPGIYPSIVADVYHAWPCCSSGQLRALRRSALHLKHRLESPQADTRALKIGRAAHCAVLEPDTFDATFAVAEQCSAKTKKGEQCSRGASLYFASFGWLCGQHAEGVPETSDNSRLIITASEYATSLRVRDAVRAHPRAKSLLAATEHTELSIVWVDDETGLVSKARFDGYAPNVLGGVVWDLKSCANGSQAAFERVVFRDGLDLQGVHYLDGAAAVALGASHYVIVAAEKDVAVVTVYRLLDEVIAAGRERVRALRRRYAECMRTGEYSGYSNDVVDLGLPRWSWSEIDAELMETAA